MKPYSRLILFFVTLAFFLALAIPRWSDPEPAVYEAALRSAFSYEVAIASSPSGCGISGDSIPGIPANLLSAFAAANALGARFGNVAALRDHFAIASSAQLGAYEQQGLHMQAAGSEHLPILLLSRVGFTPDRTEALVCLRVAAQSTLVHLHMVAGAWQVVGTEQLQIASQLPHNYSFKRTAATVCGTIMRRSAAAA